MPYIIGLTGSTASGKSSVCGRLERLGAVIIECDKLGQLAIVFITVITVQVVSIYIHSQLQAAELLHRRLLRVYTHRHTQPFNGLWSETTQVGWYQKKHSPTHTHPDHWTSFINFLHIL